MAKPAVFLDRDGVINVDHGYVHDEHDFEFVEGVFEAAQELQKMGYLLVVVTNQSGVARGMFSEDRFLSLTQWMDWNFVDNGVELDGIYYCLIIQSMAWANISKTAIVVSQSQVCSNLRKSF